MFIEGACVERCLSFKEIDQALDILMSLYEELAGEEENLEFSFVKGIPSIVLLEAGKYFLGELHLRSRLTRNVMKLHHSR